jgi:Ca2+-binding RTX toxin-like protein
VNVENLDGHSTIRLGAGLDFFSGPLDTFHGSRNSTATFAVDGGQGRDRLVGGPAADSLDGGTGADTLEGAGGADTLTGGAGSDTAVFGTLTPDPDHDAGPISVTLDGQRNDGSAGQDALVGSDVENATILFTSPPGDDVLVGNDGPNVLVGPGAVQGLGGNDTLVTDNYYPDAGKLLDGGDGDDPIGALAADPDGASALLRRASCAGPAPTSCSRTRRRPPTASAPTSACACSARARSAARASSAPASTAPTRADACSAC